MGDRSKIKDGPRVRVRFLPSGREVEASRKGTILEAARQGGVDMEASCGGRGTCGKCLVRIAGGDGGLPTVEERALLGRDELEAGFRLACRTRTGSDLHVVVPDRSLLRSQAGRKGFTAGRVTRDPPVRAFTVPFPSAKKEQGSSHLEEVFSSLSESHGLKDLVADPAVLADLPACAADSSGPLSAVVRMERELVGLRSGETGPLLGCAVDVGTTTVALYLCDLASASVIRSVSFANPQIVFGEDIVSRIAYCRAHPGTGVAAMQGELIGALNRAIATLETEEGIEGRDIVEVTVVGNTVMHHVFLGITPDCLGLWPFAPSVRDAVDVKARDLGLKVSPSAYVHLLPIEAGFVGADNVAALVSEEPYLRDETALIVDIGTNGEVALGNRSRMVCCSCATGPALEGSHITWGMRAAPGAIERVVIDPVTLDVGVKVIGRSRRAAGICGSAVIDCCAQLYGAGLLNRSGAFVHDSSSPRLRKNKGGQMEFVLVGADQAAAGRDIVLTQKDVRQVQLAKAALRAGCTMLMKKLGITGPLPVTVAGAFGSHIDPESAVAIGLLPGDARDIRSAGNAAGRGAFLALVDRGKRLEAQRIARWVEHVELAGEPEFQKEFLASLAFP